jgi:16S rRNA (cytidine1402-2'-O)-methyltransferase
MSAMTDSFYAPLPKPVTAGLYIVATPIGNLRDISLRALDILKASDVILCEDTRVAAKLLSAFALKKPLLRYDDHSGPRVLPEIVEKLQSGAVIAQISDAGTPLISDPGFRLVRAALEAGAAVHPIPGASSVLSALCISGLPTDRFMFAGFLPNKSAARKTFLLELKPIDTTLVLFETGPRLKDSLNDMAGVLGSRDACVCRELTKLYETCVRGRLSDLKDDPLLVAPKGELVVVIGPPDATPLSQSSLEAALAEALLTKSPSEASAELAKQFPLGRKDIYSLALKLKSET